MIITALIYLFLFWFWGMEFIKWYFKSPEMITRKKIAKGELKCIDCPLDFWGEDLIHACTHVCHRSYGEMRFEPNE